jgi:nucleotide-binding universal stress UspA family protein
LYPLKLSGIVKQQCGKAGEAILEVTKSEGAALLVLGSRGMGYVRRTFLGSVSDFCVHHCKVPVIVCRNKNHHDSCMQET